MKCFSCFYGLLNSLMIKKLPDADSFTSVQPVNLFYLFQALSPCLKKTTLYFLIKKNGTAVEKLKALESELILIIIIFNYIIQK